MSVTEFFFHRYQRAVQMDSANKISGKPTHNWIIAEEWIEAYKNTLSKTKQQQFEKEWKALEAEMIKKQNIVDGFKR